MSTALWILVPLVALFTAEYWLPKRWLCKFGWHPQPWETIKPAHGDGFLQYARCRHCGYKGMIDSQGNLF